MRSIRTLLGLACALLFLGAQAALAEPLFSLETESDFHSAMAAGQISPQTSPTDDLLDHYPGNTFAVSDLYVYGGMASDPDGGLVMAWGDSADEEYYAQWVYEYDVDPNLVGLTLVAVCFPPQGINSISLGIYDAAVPSRSRSWDWNVGPGGPLFPNQNNMVSVTIAGAGLGGPGEATPVANSFFDNGVNPANIVRLGFDENGNWVRFTNFNPVTGQPQPWNYWVMVQVVPEPTTLVLLVAGAGLLYRRRRK